jgi:hypothetical protein
MMKLIALASLCLSFTAPLVATQDRGEWWTSASFLTPEGSVITVKRKSGAADEVSFVFRNKKFVVPEEQIKALPRFRYDSAIIAYTPDSDGAQYVALHLIIVFNPKSPDGETTVAFVFLPDGTFKHSYSSFRMSRVPTER